MGFITLWKGNENHLPSSKQNPYDKKVRATFIHDCNYVMHEGIRIKSHNFISTWQYLNKLNITKFAISCEWDNMNKPCTSNVIVMDSKNP